MFINRFDTTSEKSSTRLLFFFQNLRLVNILYGPINIV